MYNVCDLTEKFISMAKKQERKRKNGKGKMKGNEVRSPSPFQKQILNDPSTFSGSTSQRYKIPSL